MIDFVMTKNTETDEHLLFQTSQGQLTAFETLVRRYQNKIHRHCQGLLADSDLAWDAAQETFIKVFDNCNSFDCHKKFSSWLYRIATNTCWDCWRKNKNQRVLEHQSIRVLVEEEIQLENLEKRELKEKIRGALSQLPANFRRVLEYYYFEEKNYAEIAEALGVPINTVRTWIRRGKEGLAKILKDT